MTDDRELEKGPDPPILVRIVYDDSLKPGQFRTGGVRLFNPRNDAELGREIRTRELGVADGDGVRAAQRMVAESPYHDFADPEQRVKVSR